MHIYLFIPLLFIAYCTNGQRDTTGVFIPSGYRLLETISGDLDKDGVADKILLVKGTDSSMIVTDETRGKIDRNRRGLVILLRKGKQFTPVLTNLSCFASEFEDGGVYYAPELSLYIKKGNLYAHYAHGRYGYKKFTFRFQHGDFALIGYDHSENSGPVVNKFTSVNFAAKRMVEKINTNANATGGDEVFKTYWETIPVKTLLKLSVITDFDEIDAAGH